MSFELHSRGRLKEREHLEAGRREFSAVDPGETGELLDMSAGTSDSIWSSIKTGTGRLINRLIQPGKLSEKSNCLRICRPSIGSEHPWERRCLVIDLLMMAAPSGSSEFASRRQTRGNQYGKNGLSEH